MIKKHLLWQLFPAYLFIIIVALFIITFYSSKILTYFYHEQVANDLQARARLIEQQLIPYLETMKYSELDELVKKLGRNSLTRITIILPTGQVAADSDEEVDRMEYHGDRPEIKDALEKGTGRNIRFSSTLGERMMYFALPIQEKGEFLAFIRTSIPVVAIDTQLREIYKKIVLVVIIVAIFAAAISLIVSERISRPIEQMKQTAKKFASGELDLRVPLPKPAELVELAEALNEMARQLQDRIRTITQQRNETEAVLSSMTEGVLAVDSEGHVVSINKAAAHFLKINQDEAHGRNIEEVVRNPDFQEFIKYCLNEDNPKETDVVLSGEEKRIIRLDGASLTDSTAQKSGAVVVISDITRIRRLENLRRDFVANVSHELRTPITSIKGFAETLLEGAIKQPEQAERFLQIIAKHSDRLNAIVDDLLILSSLEEDGLHRRIPFEKAPVRPVLDSVVQLSMIKAEDKKITVALDCDPDIQAKMNKILLEQAILNLVDNSIKYSEQKSRIQINAWSEEDMTAISVQDNGCGIAKKHQDRIFERFYVVDKSRSRKLGGTGLGLAIVKHIAEVHNGYVKLESSPGVGSTFTIFIPTE